jgi:hypothetical protein
VEELQVRVKPVVGDLVGRVFDEGLHVKFGCAVDLQGVADDVEVDYLLGN